MSRARLKIAAGVLAGALMSAGVAFAVIPGEDGTITGCYTKSPGLLTPQGSLRVVDTASECRSNETALMWSQSGPPGPAGPPGVTDYQMVSTASPFDGQDRKQEVAICPSGMEVIGGGAAVVERESGADRPVDNVVITRSEPFKAAGFGSWAAWAMEVPPGPSQYGGAWILRATAICAAVNAG